MSQPKWMTVANAEIGQQEVAGTAHNPRIVEYHSTTGLNATNDETPWCGSFVAWCLRQAGLKDYNRVRAASARSWMDWGRSLTKPTAGCIVVFSRTGGGHVGFYAGEDSKGRILVLGGNQNNRVSIAPYPKTHLLGYRWPAEVALPPDVEPLAKSGVLRGSAVAGGAALIVGGQAVMEAADQIDRAQSWWSSGTWIGMAAAAAVILAVGYVAFSRIRAAKDLARGGV